MKHQFTQKPLTLGSFIKRQIQAGCLAAQFLAHPQHLLAAGFAISCIHAQAQTPVTVAIPSKTEQLKTLFQIMKISETLEQMLPKLKQLLLDKYADQTLPATERSQNAKLIELYWQAISSEMSWQKIELLALPAYESQLESADIELLTQFYQTEVGIKLYKKSIDSIFDILEMEKNPQKIESIQKNFLTAKPFQTKESELAYDVATSLVLNEANQSKLDEEGNILARAFLYHSLTQHFNLDELTLLYKTVKEPSFQNAYQHFERANLAFNQIYLEHLIGVFMKSGVLEANPNEKKDAQAQKKSNTRKSASSASKVKNKAQK